MLELKIILTDNDEISILDEIALANNLSSLAYATNIIRGWIQSQLRGRYMQELQKLKPSELRILTNSSYKEISKNVELLKKGV